MKSWIDRLIHWRANHSRPDSNLAGFEKFNFQDCYVIAVRIAGEIEFDLEVYMRGNATLVFPNVRNYRWLERYMRPNFDPDGSVDYGAFDWVGQESGKYRVRGDFGEMEIESEFPCLRRGPDFIDP